MPFVFVHGVNTRKGDAYDAEEQARAAFLREIVAPVVGIDPRRDILSPYWGGEGVSFWRNLDVVPGKGVETLGGEDSLPPSLGIAIADKTVAAGTSIEAVARQSPATAIDLLFDVAASQAQGETEFRELAASYAAAQAELQGDASGSWLAATTALDLADDVFTRLQKPQQVETLGDASNLSAMLEEAGKRLAYKLPDMIAAGAVAAARRPLTEKIATFIGDAFRYLAERGDGKTPGSIAAAVLADLRKAAATAKAANEPLVVISHSFGGEIVYDILTHYAASLELEVDAWVTVGSQVGLFEEMSLLWTSPGRSGGAAGGAGGEALQAPKRVKRWINIVDGNDILGFLVTPVFTGGATATVADYHYDTGFPVAGAHSGYFRWPSFYKRLAKRLA